MAFLSVKNEMFVKGVNIIQKITESKNQTLEKIIKMRISLLYFFVVILISCNMDNVSKYEEDELYSFYVDPNLPIATAQKNFPGVGSIPWKGNVFIYDSRLDSDKISIEIATFNVTDFDIPVLRESISMGSFPKKSGRYYLNEIDGYYAGYFRLQADGDVIGKSWTTNESSKKSYIDIESIDTINKNIEASFHLFLESNYEQDLKLCEYVNILNGHFKIKY